MRSKTQSRCEVCNTIFECYQVRQKYCGHACQMRAFRMRETSRGHLGTGETSHARPAPSLRPKQPEETPADEWKIRRVWGPNQLSEIELRIMGLIPMDKVFPGGKYYLNAPD